LLGRLNRGEITHEQAIVEVRRKCGIEVPTSAGDGGNTGS